MKKFAILIVCLFFSLVSAEIIEASQAIDNFSLVQYEDGGAKKWKLLGKSADIEENMIAIDEISLLAFGKKVSLKVKAQTGYFDREHSLVHLVDNVTAKTTDGMQLTTDSLYCNIGTKDVFTDEIVRIKKDDFSAKGRGASFDLLGKVAELKNAVTAKITAGAGTSFLKKDGRERVTIITCDGPLTIDYKKNKAVFQKNVNVKDDKGDIFSDRIDIYLNPDTRAIRLIIARGNVRIVRGTSLTRSEKAIYLAEKNRVILPARTKMVIQND